MARTSTSRGNVSPADGSQPGPGNASPAGGSKFGPGGIENPSTAAMPTGEQFVAWCRSQIGKPYIWGGTGPAGYDCSGLVYAGLRSLGISAPRTSEQQWAWSQRFKDAAELAPGDLIFEQWPGDLAPPGHVVVYAGNGRVIEAPEPGETVRERAWSPKSEQAAGGFVVGYGQPAGLSIRGGTTPQSRASSTDCSAPWWAAAIPGASSVWTLYCSGHQALSFAEAVWHTLTNWRIWVSLFWLLVGLALLFLGIVYLLKLPSRAVEAGEVIATRGAA